MKLSQWARQNGYTYRGAFNVFKRGNIPNSRQLQNGTIIIDSPTVIKKEEYTVVYARVSSTENKSNLDSQAERVSQFCNANGWVVNEIVKECASGLNDSRPKFQKILTNKNITRLVVEHKDRLTRFGFEYIKTLFDGEIIIINKVNGEKPDLMEDFVSLITSFCARLYGHRRTKRKTEQLIKELQNDKVNKNNP
jgi:predicted site-specific integrase-resolvase